jgi:uncharacterized protein
MLTPERRTACLLFFFTLLEGGYIVIWFWAHPGRFAPYFGFTPDRAGPLSGWIACALVTFGFVLWSAMRLPSVRANLVRPSTLKALTIPFAISAGLLEEAVFRKMLMDGLAARGTGVLGQVMISGVAFGLAHGVWGLFGRSFRAATAAVLATTVLGLALAWVYLLAARSLAPCAIAHIVIDLFIEPGLMLAAARREMQRSSIA